MDRQHGDVVERNCVDDEAPDRRGNRFDDFGTSRPTGSAQDGFQSCLAEHLFGEIVGLGHPVGKDIDTPSRRQTELPRGVNRIRANTTDDALSTFDRFDSFSEPVRGVVAGITKLDFTAHWREHREKQRHKHHVAVVLTKLAVDAGDDIRWTRGCAVG